MLTEEEQEKIKNGNVSLQSDDGLNKSEQPKTEV